MRWAAGALLAVGAGVGAWIGGPVWGPSGYFPLDTGCSWLIWLMALLLYGVPGLVMVGLLVSLFVRLGLVGERDGLATRMALGEPRGEVVGAAARAGARSGAVGAAIGIPVGMAIAQMTREVSPMSSDTVVGESSLQWGAIAWAVAVFVGFTLLGAACAAIAYAGVTRGTPASLARENLGAAPPTATPSAPPRGWRRAVRLLPALATLYGAVIVLINRAEPLDWWAIRYASDPGVVIVAKNIGVMCAWAGGLWFGFRGAMWLVRRILTSLTAILPRGDRSGGRTFAAEGLERPTATRPAVLAINTLVAAFWAGTWVLVGDADGREHAALALDAAAVVTSVDPWAEPGLPTGLSRIGLDPDLLTALRNDPALEVVDARVLVEESYTTVHEYEMDGQLHTERVTSTPFSFAIDRDAVDGVAPDALRTLGLMDGTLLHGRTDYLLPATDHSSLTSYEDGVVLLTTWAGHTEAFAVPGVGAPVHTVDGDWARDIWGDSPVSAALIFDPAGPDDVLGDPSTSVLDAVAAHVPEGEGFVLAAMPGSGEINLPSNGAETLVGLLGAGVVVVLAMSLAAASARSRRRDLATFAALGATPRSLQAAPMWETLVVVGSAVAAGGAIGITLALATGNPILLGKGAPFDATEILWHMGRDLAATPWATLIGGFLLALAAAAAVARAMGRRMVRRTPVEELREAQKEGAR